MSFPSLTAVRHLFPPSPLSDAFSLQDVAFQVLAGAYGVIAIVALVQLFRIQFRVPEYG